MKHLRTENKNVLITFIFIIIISSTILSLILNGYFYRLKIQNDFNQSRNYQYVYTTDVIENYNSYYFINTTESTYLDIESNQHLNIEILMETLALKDEHNLIGQDDVLEGEFAPLNIDEVAISENISREYNLAIGDTIYIKNNLNDQMDAFIIKYIFIEVISSFGYTIGDSGGVMIIGYNPLKIYGLNYKYINFSHSLPLDNFTKIYYLNGLNQFIMGYLIIFNSLYIILNILFFILIQGYIFSKDKRYYEVTLIFGDDMYFRSNLKVRLCIYASIQLILNTFILEIIMFMQFRIFTWLELWMLCLSMIVSAIIFFYYTKRKLILKGDYKNDRN